MRLFALSIKLFAMFSLSGTLGFSTPQSIRADESKSAGSDAAESKSEQKESRKPEDIIFAETASPQTRIPPDAKWPADKDTRVSNLVLSSLT